MKHDHPSRNSRTDLAVDRIVPHAGEHLGRVEDRPVASKRRASS